MQKSLLYKLNRFEFYISSSSIKKYVISKVPILYCEAARTHLAVKRSGGGDVSAWVKCQLVSQFDQY